jgi:hypothetical protein
MPHHVAIHLYSVSRKNNKIKNKYTLFKTVPNLTTATEKFRINDSMYVIMFINTE